MNNIHDPNSYLQLTERRDSYQRVIDSCSKYGSTNSVPLTASALIAKEELQQKGLLLITPFLTKRIINLLDLYLLLLTEGYESLLKDCEVIIGTFENIPSCQLLFKETTHKKPSFDCCIIDDSEALPDINILSIIHSGINSIIIAGDSDGSAVCSNPIAANHKFEISLFQRIITKYE